jgi:hypothetical protein
MTLEINDLLILFGVGSLAGFINVMAGGGSALTLPALIFIGLDSATANGTNRIALLIQNIAAISSFRREKVTGLKQGVLFAVFTLPGAIVGALVAIEIGDELFRRLLAVVMIGIVISLFVSSATSGNNERDQTKHSIWIYPALFALGFYGGFLQVGIGFLLIAALFHLGRFNLVRVNMNKVLIILVYTIPALVIFTWSGHVNWFFGLSLALGNAVGAWWGARVAVRGGDRVIRIVLSLAIILMALKLFGVF